MAGEDEGRGSRKRGALGRAGLLVDGSLPKKRKG